MTARVLVTGATGYIGGRLVPELLEAGHDVTVLARTPGKLETAEWADRVHVVEGSVDDLDTVRAAMENCSAAYFLVHSMGGEDDFAARDRRHAEVFRDAAAATDTMEQLIYLGGLGNDTDDLSTHLSSRHEVGRVLASGPVPVTELRAAVIIGSGSASFEMLRNLVEVLPAMLTPRWVNQRVQPIAIRDILTLLVSVLDRPETRGEIIEVGGPDVLTYREMMLTYGEVAGLRRRLVIPVPVLSPTLSSHWVGLVTALPADLAKPLIKSLTNEVIVTDDKAARLLPPTTIGFRQSLELALRRIDEFDVRTRWADATLPGRTPADPMPSDPSWAGGTVLIDSQTATSTASPSDTFAAAAGIGGARGWYVADMLWTLRGLFDFLVGGVGMRRGRRHPDDLRVGDALDFWRVEALEPDHLLRLRAEMKLPGEAWLEWRVEPEGSGSVVHQRAIFVPRGLLGRAYWYTLVPFHALIFRRLAHAVASRGEARAAAVPETMTSRR